MKFLFKSGSSDSSARLYSFMINRTILITSSHSLV